MATMITIPSTSIEYVHAPITGDFTTSMTVQMAIITADTEPVTGDWKTAAWDGTDGNADAKILIGTGTSVGALTEGVYGVWVKITATPEIPVICSGRIRIT